ncbi:MAG: Short-chain dehydrogenase/reductase prx4 [Claussenomyces sp. TS43310]|nr:MAG: Short-chain dehydrogenase/reductase prx4 [Claussenomyces sp. TS43310]
MASLRITDGSIPSLTGKVAVITGKSPECSDIYAIGGTSGIGLAAVKILVSKGAKVYALDLNPPDEPLPYGALYVKCNTASWSELVQSFKQAGHVDIAIANAGVSETVNHFEDQLSEEGELQEPTTSIIDVNYRGVLSFVKLALHYMRRQGKGGSIVITVSATAYAPEQSLPVYSATKHALVGLIRSLRSSLPSDNISINGVAPAATITKLLPQNLATPLMAAGLPVSNAHFVGLAVVYSAVAHQTRTVEPYGKDSDDEVAGKWNGRVIMTLGETYTELEEPIARLRPQWFGEQNTILTRKQQAATDFRHMSQA